jgi:hypothetical protein
MQVALPAGTAAPIAAVTVALAMSPTLLLARPALADTASQKSGPRMTVIVPTNVLEFPATVTSGNGGDDTSGGSALTPEMRQVQDIVTDAFRDYMHRAGIGIVTYNRLLPSVQRGVAEGTIKADDAVAGPGDDPRNALRFALLNGASEYVTIDVTNYKYDVNSRTVNFNVSVQRCTTEAEGMPLGTVAKPAVGTAQADIPPYRQEDVAVENAASAVAEETFQDLYPQVAELMAGREARANRAKK